MSSELRVRVRRGVAVAAAVGVVVAAGLVTAGASPVSAGADGTSGPVSVGSGLGSGATLSAGEMLVAPGGEYAAVMQGDGNFVVYFQSDATVGWASDTAGNEGASVTMQADGNLVVYDAAGDYVWDSNTDSYPGATLALADDGNLVISAGGTTVWASDTIVALGPQLDAGQTLGPNQMLESSNGQYRLINPAGVGTLVVYDTTTDCPLAAMPALERIVSDNAATFTPATSADSYLTMQSDGNLVLYSPDGSEVFWSSGTSGSGSANIVVMQDDGNLVMYAAAGGPAVWSTGTETVRGWGLCPGSTLEIGQSLVTPVQANGTHQGTLSLGSDCALTMSSGSKSWSSPTSVETAGDRKSVISQQAAADDWYVGCFVVMQSDGNLVMYAPNYPGGQAAMWSSGTAGNDGAVLIMQDGACQTCDANASIYSTDGTLLTGAPDHKSGISLRWGSSESAMSAGRKLIEIMLG